jgi:urea transport system permease protein
MFGYSFGELGSILAMQGFAGLILFSVYLLMALGLAIIFGQMGVINMAHGEFMILGAYMTYFCSHLFATYLPGLYGGYFFVAMVVAFIASGAAGLVVEWALIQRLYKRPLDTLLATWGLSLIMQQAFRSGFGAREVGVELPQWMMGSLHVTDTIEVQINGLFVMGLTLLITAGVALLLFRSRWGLQVRSVVANRTMAGAVGIDTRRIDRFTFGLGCGIAGVAGSAFTMIGSTGPTAGQLYIIVDTFLVVVFGGAQSLLGTIASALTISQSQSTLEFFLTGSMAKVLTLLIVIGILMLRPQGLFAVKVRRQHLMDFARMDSRRLELIGFALIAVVIVVILPLAFDIFRLNLFGKYLTYAFVAIGLVLCWGHTGILSLGQGLFFGLGGYCMAAFLKLEASSVANTKIQSTPGIPDFMDWNQLTALPYFWVPFKWLPFALVAVIAVPTILAFILGAALFKRRVGGVYFAIITQALAAVMTILIIGQQGYTGGINGITDLRTLLGWDIRTDNAKYILYFVCCVLLLGTMFVARFVLASKLGRILVAVRDKEDRVRFSGYDVANYKIFVFCLASAMAAVGGAMFTLQVGFMSPSFVGIVPSIEMVIFCAVGGRQSIVGAVAGTLLVNWAKTLFSEAFPELWLFAMGGLFIAVVIAFPRGVAGLVTDQIIPKLGLWKNTGDAEPSPAPAPAE